MKPALWLIDAMHIQNPLILPHVYATDQYKYRISILLESNRQQRLTVYKVFYDQAYSCPKDWRLTASWQAQQSST